MLKTLALIYQYCVETRADPSAEMILGQRSRLIHQTFVSHQTQRKNDRVLINVAAENYRHLNITPLYILDFEASPSKVYNMEVHNTAKKRNFSDLGIESLTSLIN